MMTKRPNGFILWEGPSAIDGAPIVAIATGLNGSTNRKTGSMVQTYILRRDMAPTEAVKRGADASICGSCPHRGDGTGKGRTCYVNVGRGPGAVYRAYRNGSYPRVAGAAPAIAALGKGRKVRLGTYGDPAAVPVEVWQALVSEAEGHTGYTHQWQAIAASAWAPLVMASADTRELAVRARGAGWRTFRVDAADAPKLAGEILCPASEQAGKKVTCAQCLACGGGERKGSIYIPLHGGFAVMANRDRLIARVAA